MTTITASILDRAGETLGGFLPRVAGALLLLLVGVLLARLLGRLITRALERVGLDALAERFRAGDVLDRAGLGRSVSRLIGRAIRVALTLVVIFAALSLLGLQFLSESLNQAVLFLPKLGVAAVLLLVGVVLGTGTRARRAARPSDGPARPARGRGPSDRGRFVRHHGCCPDRRLHGDPDGDRGHPARRQRRDLHNRVRAGRT